jgi:hypothetical protein
MIDIVQLCNIVKTLMVRLYSNSLNKQIIMVKMNRHKFNIYKSIRITMFCGKWQ